MRCSGIRRSATICSGWLHETALGRPKHSISCRFLKIVEELLGERGLEADPTTIWRWVQRYAPELEERRRRHLKPTNKSWRVDETYVRVKGRWCYLYRAIDSTGATIDFVLSGLRDAAAAKRLFRKALAAPSHPQTRVINTDRARIYNVGDPRRARTRTVASPMPTSPAPYKSPTRRWV